MLSDIYLQLIGLPIVFFSIEFSQHKWTIRNIKKLCLICVFFSAVSSLAFIEASFSAPFIFNWAGSFVFLPPVSAMGAKFYEKRHPNNDYSTIEHRVFGGICLCAGLFSVIYALSSKAGLFINANVENREIFASRILYFSYGMYSIVYGIIKICKNKKDE